MRSYKNLTLIGSSHIAKQSVREIEQAFERLNPEIIAVELDRQRLPGLMSGDASRPSWRAIGRVGMKGFLFALLGGWASRKLGRMVGMSPGSEMKRAIELGLRGKKRVALIDQPIEITLRKFSKALTWKEKGRMLLDLFSRKKLAFDISKVPEEKLISTLLEEVRARYPSIHKVLIHERNYYMARKLKALMSLHPDRPLLAVVGAGHADAIIKILEENAS